MLRFPPKTVGIVCSVQVTMLVGVILISRAMLKFYLKAVVPPFGEMPWRFRGTLQLLLTAGPWLLVVPFAWGLWATLNADEEGGTPMLSPAQTHSGYILTFAVLVFCVIGGIQSLCLAFDPIPVSRMKMVIVND